MPRLPWSVLLLGVLGCSGAEPAAPLPQDSGGSSSTTGVVAGGATSGGAAMAGSPSGSAGTTGQLAAGAGTGGTSTNAGGTESGGGAGGASAGATSGGSAPSSDGGTASAGAASGGRPPVDPALLPSVTLHLAGDSTVMTYAADSAQEGWGQELPPLLLPKVSLDNQAIGGASVETFYTGRWQNILGNLHAGDYVLAAFGANDSGTVADRHVEPSAFQTRFQTMASEVAAKQATFIIVTPSALQEWSGGKNGNQRLGPYVSVLHTLSESSGVKLVDLNARSLELLNQIGQEAAKEIYINGDKAHFTKKGATSMAKLVVQELQRIGSPLGDYAR